MTTKHIHKSHNVTCLLFHLVCPAKYRKKVFTPEVEQTLKAVCFGISERYEIHFVEIGADENHVHFMIQTVPMTLLSHMVQSIKSITAKQIFLRHPEAIELLWGGEFWTDGYYLNTVGRSGNEETISNYVKNQGLTYKQIYRGQLTLFT